MAEKHLNKCLKSLVIREMQIKINLRLYLKPIRISKIITSGDKTCCQECGERGKFLQCWWDCKLVQPLWKSVWRFFRNLEIGPSNTNSGHIHRRCSKCNKDTCSTKFIAALFIIARSWKQLRCHSTEEWIQKMCYIYTMEYYSAIKNEDFKA
jgi:hypothetical protein